MYSRNIFTISTFRPKSSLVIIIGNENKESKLPVSICDPKQGQNFKVLEGQYIFTTIYMIYEFFMMTIMWLKACLTISAAVTTLLLAYE